MPHAARRLSLCVAGLAALTACAPIPGEVKIRPAEEGTDRRIVVSAGGRDVVVAPPAGFCIDRDAVRDQGVAVFVLIEDCALSAGGAALADVSGAAVGAPQALPALVNGLITLSIGAESLYAKGDRPAGEARLEAFLRTDEGRVTAGMGGGADQIRIVESRMLSSTLFVLVEDESREAAPGLGPRIWRAFTELNGRAAIAALGVFESSAIGDAAMLAHLARVVAALKMANGDGVGPIEAQLALAAPRPRRRPDQHERNVRVNANGVSAPMPQMRPDGHDGSAGAPASAAVAGIALPKPWPTR
ncbi:MAG: hypothetical protein ACI9ZH_001153 [Paracoccaceae bacterium]|jgi:hypothetical protein